MSRSSKSKILLGPSGNEGSWRLAISSCRGRVGCVGNFGRSEDRCQAVQVGGEGTVAGCRLVLALLVRMLQWVV